MSFSDLVSLGHFNSFDIVFYQNVNWRINSKSCIYYDIIIALNLLLFVSLTGLSFSQTETTIKTTIFLTETGELEMWVILFIMELWLV